MEYSKEDLMEAKKQIWGVGYDIDGNARYNGTNISIGADQ